MKKQTVFQVGTINALVEGVYESGLTFSELSKHGGFGLGTLNGVDGEMIAFDNEFYQIDSTGKVNKITHSAKTPFSVVSDFSATQHFSLENLNSMEELESAIDLKLPSLNYIYLMRIEGFFPYIKMRSLACQNKPYRPLSETLDAKQKIFEAHDTEGTLVVTRFPNYLASVNVPGYHIHYLDNNKSCGGHVFNLKISKANVGIACQQDLKIRFIYNELFAQADLDKQNDKSIERIEKQR